MSPLRGVAVMMQMLPAVYHTIMVNWTLRFGELRLAQEVDVVTGIELKASETLPSVASLWDEVSLTTAQYCTRG